MVQIRDIPTLLTPTDALLDEFWAMQLVLFDSKYQRFYLDSKAKKIVGQYLDLIRLRASILPQSVFYCDGFLQAWIESLYKDVDQALGLRR